MAQRQHQWFCGPFKRDGMAKYVHMIRGPYDPERSSREQRKGQTTAWRDKIKATSAKEWEAKLLEYLSDGEPRTVNRMAVELLDQTADVCAPPLVNALWELHAQCKVECTIEAPIYFRIKGSKREPAGKPGQMRRAGEKKTVHKRTRGLYADRDDLADEISRSAMDEQVGGSDPDAEDIEDAAPPTARAPRRAQPKRQAADEQARARTLDALAKKSLSRNELKKKFTSISKSTELQPYGYQIVIWFDPVAKRQLVEFVPRATEQRGHKASVHPRVTVTSREDQLAFHKAIGAPPPSNAPLKKPRRDAADDALYASGPQVPEGLVAETIPVRQLKSHGYTVVAQGNELAAHGYDTFVWYNPDDMTEVREYVPMGGNPRVTVQHLEDQLALHKALGAPPPAKGQRLKSVSASTDVTLTSATQVYVPTDGSPTSIACALWAFTRGRTNPIIVFWPEKCAPVTRAYVESFAKTFDLTFFAGSLKAAMKKYGKAGSIAISDATTLEAASALTKLGAAHVTAPFVVLGGTQEAYDLLATAGVRHHPSFVLAPDQGVQADPCALKRMQKAAKSIKGNVTFEKALASATILSGDFPATFVLYDDVDRSSAG